MDGCRDRAQSAPAPAPHFPNASTPGSAHHYRTRSPPLTPTPASVAPGTWRWGTESLVSVSRPVARASVSEFHAHQITVVSNLKRNGTKWRLKSLFEWPIEEVVERQSCLQRFEFHMCSAPASACCAQQAGTRRQFYNLGNDNFILFEQDTPENGQNSLYALPTCTVYNLLSKK